MAYETTFEQDKALDDSNTTANSFIQRVSKMLPEADSYLSNLNAAKTTLTAVRTAVDAAVSANAEDAAAVQQQLRVAKKQAEIDSLITQATGLRAAINTAVNG